MTLVKHGLKYYGNLQLVHKVYWRVSSDSHKAQLFP